MKRIHSFLLGLLAFGLFAISGAGLFFCPPCISGPSVPRQYPLFAVSLCLNYVLGMVIFAVAGASAFYYALREN